MHASAIYFPELVNCIRIEYIAGMSHVAPDTVSPHGLAALLDQVARTTFGFAYGDGLNPAQWGALRYYAKAGPGARTVNDFVRFQGTTQGTASRTIGALVAKGLLARREDDRDRRRARLDVTPAGLALLESDPLLILAEALATLAPDRRAAVADGLADALGALLDRRAESQRPRRASTASRRASGSKGL